MSCTILTLKFFGGLILLFAVGYVIGYLLKLDKYFKNDNQEKKEDTNQIK